MAGHNGGTKAENRGRCKRCKFSYPNPNPLYKDRLCGYYGRYCVRVAWNCLAPPEGYL